MLKELSQVDSKEADGCEAEIDDREEIKVEPVPMAINNRNSMVLE